MMNTIAPKGHGLRAKLPKFDHEIRPYHRQVDPSTQLWSACADMGWGALCQAFGRMCSEGCLTWERQLQRQQAALR